MPSDQGIQTPLPPSAFARLATAARYAISGVAPTTWFGPQQPLAPMAPPEVKGRQFDYPFGINIDYTPRSTSAIGFAELRGLADALPLLRTVIETRKDQIAGTSFSVRLRDPAGDSAAAAGRIKAVLAFLDRPDRRHSFAAWLRMLLEDMLVIDAATIYPRLTRAGALYSLDIIDGATITPLVGEDGRAPEPPDPAYQQILHGIPAADFSSDELLYLPRNARAHRLYGLSPVEQIALTVNIALRRDAMTLEYYQAGSTPVEWIVAGLSTLTVSAVAFIWRLMTRLERMSIAIERQRADFDADQMMGQTSFARLSEMLAQLRDDHCRLRETIGVLPSRGDLRDLEDRIGERIDTLAARFDRALEKRGI